MRILLISVCLVASAACSSGDSEDAEVSIGDDGELSAAQNGVTATATITTPEGTAIMRSGDDAPLDLPGGFTLYPDAKVTSNTVFSQGNSKGALIVMESEASPKDMADFYRKQADIAGIEVQVEMAINEGQMIGGESENGRTFSFNANPDGEKTMAQLMVGERLGM